MKHKPLKMDRKLAIDSKTTKSWVIDALSVVLAVGVLWGATALLKWTVERERVRVEQMEAVR
jgi:hypothetical protein